MAEQEAPRPGKLVRAIAVIAAASLAACTHTASGTIGSTLSGGGVNVTLQRVDRQPPVPRADVTGLSTPAPGTRLIGARFRVCSSVGQAIGTFNFSISLDGGGSGSVKFPSMNYPDSFEIVRTGCAEGWIVFQIPQAAQAQEIAFKFDDTGNQGSINIGGRQPAVHDHFSWTLSSA
jgi:hypothetical protein